LHGQFRHGRQNDLFSSDFPGQLFHLLLKHPQEEQCPGLLVRRIGPDCFLRLA
jgi:hypothetical protein